MRFTCIGLVEQDVLAARGEGDCNAKLGITILGEAVNVEDEIVVINSIVLPNKTLNILVATAGRLKDHIEHTTGFATRLMGVKVLVLVLDEADLLLDMGFRKDIEKIIAAVPKERQTLLFSATVPRYSKSPASTLLILAYH